MIYDAAGRQRKATSGDISLVSPTRPKGIVDVTIASHTFVPVFSCKNYQHMTKQKHNVNICVKLEITHLIPFLHETQNYYFFWVKAFNSIVSNN